MSAVQSADAGQSGAEAPPRAKPGVKSKKASARAPSTGRRPLAARLLAWLNGEGAGNAVKSKKPAAAQRQRTRGEGAKGAKGDALPVDEASLIRALEDVWGKGFLAPGGGELPVDLVKPLGLNAAVSLLEIGAGLGGGSCAIAAKFETYVSAFEINSKHCKAATELAIQRDLDKQAVFQAYHPNEISKMKLRADYFHAALVHDQIYRFEKKGGLVAELARTVKPRGQIIIADLFAGADPLESAAQNWVVNSPDPVYLCTPEEIKESLAQNHLAVKIFKDDSEMYASLILKAWSEGVRRIDAMPMHPQVTAYLLQNAEHWARLLTALKTGDVRYLRILAVKERKL
jgi:ubiquinone/menaquinone biosynthesis C-methylase UbiE